MTFLLVGGRVGEGEFSGNASVYSVLSGGNADDNSTICALTPYPGTVDSHVMIKYQASGVGWGEVGAVLNTKQQQATYYTVQAKQLA